MFNADSHVLKTVYGCKAVRPLKEIRDFRGSFGNGAEHHRAVGDGFIAGDCYFSAKSFCWGDFHK
jgi:hypothetical protein